jgi:MFS transporter, DHA1 family, inner membrane transport protein
MFTSYTYLADILEKLAGFDGATVGWILMGFGGVGLFGNWAGGRLVDRHPLGASSNISGCNIGIALGAFIGSRMIDLFGLASVGLAGAVIIVAAMAATLSLVTTPHRLPQPS